MVSISCRDQAVRIYKFVKLRAQVELKKINEDIYGDDQGVDNRIFFAGYGVSNRYHCFLNQSIP